VQYLRTKKYFYARSHHAFYSKQLSCPNSRSAESRLTITGKNEDPVGTSDLAPCLGFLSFFADFQQLCLTMMPPCDVPRTWSAVTLAWL
jgi:hypothetical protein